MLFSLDLGIGVIPSVIVNAAHPINLIHAFSNGYLLVTGEETLDDTAIVDFGSFHELHFVPPSFESADVAHPEDEYGSELDDLESVTSLQEDESDSLDHEHYNESVPLTPPIATAQDFSEGSASHESPFSPDGILDISRGDSGSSYSRKCILFSPGIGLTLLLSGSFSLLFVFLVRSCVFLVQL